MKPDQITQAVEAMLKASQPAFLWGAPGIGKSQVMHQTAARLGLPLIDLRAILLDPVDLRGIPHINGDGRSHWAIPEFLPRDGAGVLFLDELPQASAAMQAACLQLTLDRAIGDYRLPDGWQIVAAGNRVSDRAGTHTLITPLTSRFVHLDFEIDVDQWCRWALGSNKVRSEIVAFIRFRPELIHAFDAKARAFPCPRSWEFASRVVNSALPCEIELELLNGTLGTGAATELAAFLRIFRQLPNVDAVLLDPANAQVPAEASVKFALAGALSRRATDTNFDRVCTYAERLGEEISAYAVKDAIARDGSLVGTSTFIRWASDHADLLN